MVSSLTKIKSVKPQWATGGHTQLTATQTKTHDERLQKRLQGEVGSSNTQAKKHTGGVQHQYQSGTESGTTD